MAPTTHRPGDPAQPAARGAAEGLDESGSRLVARTPGRSGGPGQLGRPSTPATADRALAAPAEDGVCRRGSTRSVDYRSRYRSDVESHVRTRRYRANDAARHGGRTA